MDYEKAYNELKAKIQGIHDRATGNLREEIEKEIPELKDSEDETMRKKLISIFQAYRNPAVYTDPLHWEGLNLRDIIAWLEKQKPVEWSEKDEFIRKTIIEIFNLENFKGYGIENEEAIGWLISIHPQSSWKPTKLQLDCLSDVIKNYGVDYYEIPTLRELYKQLREL